MSISLFSIGWEICAMKCLFTYKWVKLPRAHIPTGKGLMGSFLRLASRAAFRPGKARYCGYTNDVNAGSWVGGIVGLKAYSASRIASRCSTSWSGLWRWASSPARSTHKRRSSPIPSTTGSWNVAARPVPPAPSTPPKATASFAFRETSQKGLSDRNTALANLTHGLTSGATLYGETVITHSQDWRQPFKLCAVNRYSRLKALAHAGVGRKPKSGASLKSMRIPFRFISSPAPMAASYSTISIRRTLARWKPQPTPS